MKRGAPLINHGAWFPMWYPIGYPHRVPSSPSGALRVLLARNGRSGHSESRDQPPPSVRPSHDTGLPADGRLVSDPCLFEKWHVKSRDRHVKIT